MKNLNINIDHFATLRNARGECEPNLFFAAKTAELAGASGIVMHLRKDRRHIKDNDVIEIKANLATHLNLEMSMDSEIVDFACKVKPTVATLVPEEPSELTTEGGLDVIKYKKNLITICKRLRGAGTEVSMFIEPNTSMVEMSKEIGANRVELNTKNYALACKTNNWQNILNEFEILKQACEKALDMNLYVAAGHSLNYHNINKIVEIADIKEYNIGHSIVSRAVFIGLLPAVKEMFELINR